MQLVYKAANVTEAQIVRGMLQANGIEAHVGGYYLQGGVGEMSTMDFAHVHVQDSDVGTAREIIRDYEDLPPATTSTPGSRTNGYSSLKIKLVIVIITALAAGLLMLNAGT